MTEYVCQICEEESIDSDRYDCASIAEFCETCGHLSDFYKES